MEYDGTKEFTPEQIKRFKECKEHIERLEKEKIGLTNPKAIERRDKEIKVWQTLLDMEREGKAPRKIRTKHSA